MERERVHVYAYDTAQAELLMEHIKTLPFHNAEALITKDGLLKIEFTGTMLDGVTLMGLGAASFGRM